MPSEARTAARRLSRAARRLHPTVDPYYMHNPRPGRERYGPGWYWQPVGADLPEYLATNAYEADHLLRQLVADADQAEDTEPAGALVVLPRVAA